MVHLGRYLRIDDNPILEEAAARQERMLPVFALDPTERRGRAQEAFLMSALAQMQQALRARGSDLLVIHEPPPTEVADRYTSPMRMIADEDLPFDAAKMRRSDKRSRNMGCGIHGREIHCQHCRHCRRE
jgi:deoxyribodipyrimidine photolyase